MIGTAGTLKAAAQTVMDEGASRVFAAATHGVFSGNALREPRHRAFEQIVVTDTIPLGAGRAGQHPRALLRRPADGLDPPHLHRRLGVRGLRRREPALLSARPRACRSCSASPTRSCCRRSTPTRSSCVGGELDHRPELPILLDLLAEAEERAGARGAAALGPRDRAGTAARSTCSSPATSARFEDGSRRSPSAASCCAAAAEPT